MRHPPLAARSLRAVALAALALSCAAPRAEPAAPAAAPPPEPVAHGRTGLAPSANPFLHAVGRDLVDGQGRKVVLKGICFGNDVWSNGWSPTANHHGEAEFEAVAALGMNAARFYLSYRFFEEDDRPYQYKPEGFAWLDRNLAWARKHGVYLVLNMHVPQGGFQSLGRGGALWRDPENQRRFVALWREIARRYRDEPALAGYDLLNEPVVATDPAQWERLAKRALLAIREVDPAHAVFVERLNAVIGAGPNPDWTEDRNGRMNFFLLDDTNVVYEFHFYKPMAMTHQGASWVPPLAHVRTTYPGPFRDWDGVQKTGDRAYLERELRPYFDFGKAQDVPLFLGEYGVIRDGFAAGRNGAGWVSDVIELALGAGVSLTYHDLHEDAFGLYATPASQPPARRNEALAQVFAGKFGAASAR
jgi:hypothetical protein